MKRSRHSTWIAFWTVILLMAASPVWGQTAVRQAPPPTVNVGYLEHIAFESLPGRERVILKVSQQTGVSVDDQGGNAVLVRLDNLFVPEGLRRPLSASGLANVVRITPQQRTADGRSWVMALIDLRQKVPCSVMQVGTDVLIDFNVASLASAPPGASAVQKTAAPEKAAVPVKAPTGPRVSIDVQDAELQAVFRLLAEYANVSIVAGDDVKGTITLHMKDVSWNQALDTVLKIKGLAKIEHDRVILVMSQENFLIRKKTEEAVARQEMKQADTEPLVTRVVPIKYRLLKFVTASKIDLKRDVMAAGSAVVQPQSAGFPAGGSMADSSTRKVTMEGAGDFFALLQSLLSTDSEGRQRGWIGADADTNSIIITAVKADMIKIMSMIEKIDIPTDQILIKAHIVETTKSMARDLGITWGGQYSAAIGNHTAFVTPDIAFPAIPLAGTAATLGLAFGTIGGNILDLQLSALQRDGKLNILSSPSIMTLDNQPAHTENGEKIPIRTLDKDGNPITTYVPATLRLDITPHVIDGENLKMDIHVKKDEVDLTRNVLNNPFIINKETKTNLMVRNGETIVISGLTKQNMSENTTGLPWLKDVPGFGWLFKGQQKSDSMEEVLIFITPTVIKAKIVAGIQTGS